RKRPGRIGQDRDRQRDARSVEKGGQTVPEQLERTPDLRLDRARRDVQDFCDFGVSELLATTEVEDQATTIGKVTERDGHRFRTKPESRPLIRRRARGRGNVPEMGVLKLERRAAPKVLRSVAPRAVDAGPERSVLAEALASTPEPE